MLRALLLIITLFFMRISCNQEVLFNSSDCSNRCTEELGLHVNAAFIGDIFFPLGSTVLDYA